MKKWLIIVPFLLFADVDPFMAGVDSGYGLTPTEKVVLNNKKEIKLIKNDLNGLKTKFVILESNLNDLQSKFSSFNSLLGEIDKAHNEIEKLNKKVSILNDNNLSALYLNLEKRVSKLEKNLTSISNQLSLIRKEQKALRDSLDEMTKIQNENFTYLSNSIKTILETLKNRPQTSKVNLSPKEAFKKAKNYFMKKEYSKAKELFLYTYKKRYFPATSLFYLGEIAYLNKNYNEALTFYKKSIKLYPKPASFTPKLLFHTGIAFSKIGQKDASKLTFLKLIADFPNSIYAKEAKKYLNN